MNPRTPFPLFLFCIGFACAGPIVLRAQPPSFPAAHAGSAAGTAVLTSDELPSAPAPQPISGDTPLLALAGQNQAPPPNPQPPQNSSSEQAPPAPSLSDLGFSAQQTQADPKLQARLDKRTNMLKIHQRLGLITTIPMVATLITGPMVKAKGKDGQPIKEPTQANLDFHAALGGTTAALYFSTAYFAMFAPKIPGTKHRGPIRLHEALAFIHGPGMIATPILGAMAFKQENAGERVHGIASAHGAVAISTVIAYGAAMVAVSWPLKFKRHASSAGSGGASPSSPAAPGPSHD